MDRLDEIAVLVAVLDTGSLAAAGRRLHRSPPAVTRAIAALEQRVGVRLIERTTRRLAPTEAGRALAERARLLLDGYADAMQVPMEAALRGTLRITAPVVFGRRHVTPCVLAFQQAHPDLRVELLLSDRNQDLVEEGLDVAVRIGPLADSGLVVRQVGAVRRVVVASPGYLATHGTPATPADLAGHATIVSFSRGGLLEWRFRDGGRERVVRLTPRLMVSDVEAMLLAARSGHGVARALSYQVAAELEAGTLVRLLADYEPAAEPVRLVFPGGGMMRPSVRAFVEFGVAYLRRLPVVAV
ncbi:MAG: LysR family transcriptional regulator [Rhodopila sp.]|nr:LysR family transcriptional regulator [Rhodopila sp.]